MKQMRSLKNFLHVLKRYQKGLEEKMRGNEFVYDSINLLHYKLHRLSIYRGESYIDSPE